MYYCQLKYKATFIIFFFCSWIYIMNKYKIKQIIDISLKSNELSMPYTQRNNVSKLIPYGVSSESAPYYTQHIQIINRNFHRFSNQLSCLFYKIFFFFFSNSFKLNINIFSCLYPPTSEEHLIFINISLCNRIAKLMTILS